MKRSKIFAASFLAAANLFAAAPPARTQTGTTPVASASLHGKETKTRFEVLRMMRTGIQVRSLTDSREIYTFTYSDRILSSMQNLFDHGGYKYGDKVIILYKTGTEVALNIRGKPSK
jgi:hypothetical protein